jgi:hypothetical protein
MCYGVEGELGKIDNMLVQFLEEAIAHKVSIFDDLQDGSVLGCLGAG